MDYKDYDDITVVGERSAGNDQVGDMWLETLQCKKGMTLEDVIKWADTNRISGRLIITVGKIFQGGEL